MAYIEMTIRSAILDMDTKVDVILPENRHETKLDLNRRYPVLYLLHGMKDDNSTWSRLSTINLLVRDLDLIVVMPTTYRGFYVNNRYGLDYYHYISEELPIKMANYFPISQKPEDTYIMGDSMGGYGTLRIALSKPENFRKAICLSGGALPPKNMHSIIANDQMIGVFGSDEEYRESDNNLERLVDKFNNFQGNKPDIIFYCGTEDMMYEHSKAFVAHIKAQYPNLKIKDEYWHGQHNYHFWNSALPKALQEMGFKITENSII